MNSPDNDLGIISLLLRRFEKGCLPAMLALKRRVDAGAILSNAEVEYLHRVLEELKSAHLASLLERHQEFMGLIAAVLHTYRQIIDRALENEQSGVALRA